MHQMSPKIRLYVVYCTNRPVIIYGKNKYLHRKFISRRAYYYYKVYMIKINHFLSYRILSKCFVIQSPSFSSFAAFVSAESLSNHVRLLLFLLYPTYTSEIKENINLAGLFTSLLLCLVVPLLF